MARQTIQSIELPLVERLGSAYVERALAPFPLRANGDLWGLNRQPYHHPNLFNHPWPGLIELGEELPGELTLEERESTTRAASSARAAATPRTLAWSYAVSCTGAAGVLNAVTTDPIPWPFRITGFSCKPSDAAVAVNHAVELQLILTDDYQPSVPTEVLGERLLPRARAIGGSGVLWGLRFIAVTNAAASTQQANQAYATAVIGRTVLEANKHICLAFQQSDANAASFDGHITVEEYAGATAVVPRATTTRTSSSITRTTAPALPRQIEPAPRLAYFGAGAAPRYAGNFFGAASTRTAQTSAFAVGEGQTGQAYTLPQYPGLTFATRADADRYARANP